MALLPAKLAVRQYLSLAVLKRAGGERVSHEDVSFLGREGVLTLLILFRPLFKKQHIDGQDKAGSTGGRRPLGMALKFFDNVRLFLLNHVNV